MSRSAIFRTLRLLILLPLLAGALLLYHWSRENDPRFHYFITSSPGRVIARVFRWPGVHARLEERPESAMTPEERRIKAELEQELLGAAPTHHLMLRDGKSILGRLLEEGPQFVRFEESFGNSGSLEARVRRSRILYLEPLEEPVPEITYRDVRFRMEFPDIHLFKRSPYTIATDEKYFRVEGAVRILQDLHEEFTEVFADLFTVDAIEESIQVLFFSDEKPFRRYQRRYAPRLDSSVGFYSPSTDRFALFNQQRSQQMEAFGKRLEAQAERYRANRQMYGGEQRIDEWKERAGRQMSGLAAQQTRATIRHEGAHQLFFAYGVHSPHRIENDWLYEGLAVYCETPRIGEISRFRAGVVKQSLSEDHLVPLPDLVNHRSRHGLFGFGESREIDAAYSQAWSLVHFLMQPDRRERFFRYLEYVRNREQFWRVFRTPRYELLCRYMETDPAALEAAWRAHVRAL